jgi:hypothetical protein
LKSGEKYAAAIATKWLTLLFLPMLPVRSFEVAGEQRAGDGSVQYALEPLPELEIGQVMETLRKYTPGYLFRVAILIGFTLLGTWRCFWQ